MSKMINAVIITRTDAYFELNSSKVKEDRSNFGNAILAEDNGERSFSQGKYALKKYLKAKQYLKNWGDDFSDIAHETFGITIPENIQDTENEEEYVIKELVKSDSLLEKDDFPSKCYVSFQPEDVDAKKEIKVVLILWDRLERSNDEQIEDLKLFFNSIIEDCSIKICDKDIENFLYIHDKQVFSDIIGPFKDATIWNEKGLTDNSFAELYESFKNYFVSVATFGHAAGSVTFNEGILKFKFGEPTPVDRISEIEDETVSFSELRSEADKILKETRQKNCKQ